MKSTSAGKQTGNDPRRRDILIAAAARVHEDADSVSTATMLGKTDRTGRRWKSDGRGSPQHAYSRYFLANPHKYRLLSHLKALAKAEAIQLLTNTALIARYHELHEMEKNLECQDTVTDLKRGVSWLDRAAMKERDAAIDEEIAAVCRELAARGITEEEVFG